MIFYTYYKKHSLYMLELIHRELDRRSGYDSEVSTRSILVVSLHFSQTLYTFLCPPVRHWPSTPPESRVTARVRSFSRE